MNIFIDGNALGWAHHSVANLTFRGKPVQAIFGFIRMLRDIRNSNPSAKITVLWDGYARERYEFFPEYKGDRKAAREVDPEAADNYAAYKSQLPLIQRATTDLGIDQMLHTELEADDCFGLIVRMTPGKKIRCHTGDEDWLQHINELVSWFDPRKDGKLVTHLNFHESTGYFTPNEFLEGKALQGDTSDSIPGIPGFGEKTAVKFLAQHRSVRDWLVAVDIGDKTPTKRKTKGSTTAHPEEILASPEGRAIFERNMKLMDLRNVQVPKTGEMKVTKGQYDETRIRQVCDALGFVSLTRYWDTWLLPFRTSQSATTSQLS